ncbi:MAG: hypothetical protein EP303_00110 [Deltaproteobacteria bacterium]|nr:MAG: hypothetical protein EP303_00110 [Deltaproteobacteria bacterium]
MTSRSMKVLSKRMTPTSSNRRNERAVNIACELKRSTSVWGLKKTASVAGVAVLMTVIEASGGADIEEARPIVLRVGEQKSLSARGIRSYSEGASGVADIRVTRDQSRFVIVGKKEGTTSLLLITNDGGQLQHTIRVIPAGADKGFGGRENIRLDLYFVLIQDRYSHQIGLNWPGNIGSTITPSEAAISITGGSGQATQSAFQILPQTFLPSPRPKVGRRCTGKRHWSPPTAPKRCSRRAGSSTFRFRTI